MPRGSPPRQVYLFRMNNLPLYMASTFSLWRAEEGGETLGGEGRERGKGEVRQADEAGVSDECKEGRSECVSMR